MHFFDDPWKSLGADLGYAVGNSREAEPMMGGRSWDQWIVRYALSHHNRVNRACHTVGIPLIALSLPLFLVCTVTPRFWPWPLALFAAGWTLQFIGHAFEGKPPEFFHDYRFLFVGLRWWWAKVNGRA